MSVLIINVQDQMIGSWHQLTVERDQNSLCPVRLDGQDLHPEHPLAMTAKRLVCEWDDFFEGCTDKENMCDQIS